MRENVRISIGRGIHAGFRDSVLARVGVTGVGPQNEEGYYLRPGEFYDALVTEDRQVFYTQMEGVDRRSSVDIVLLDPKLAGRVEIDYGDGYVHPLTGHERIPDDVRQFMLRLSRRGGRK